MQSTAVRSATRSPAKKSPENYQASQPAPAAPAPSKKKKKPNQPKMKLPSKKEASANSPSREALTLMDLHQEQMFALHQLCDFFQNDVAPTMSARP